MRIAAVVATLLLAAAPAPGSDETQIRALRAENDAALEARDPARIAAAYAPGYVVIRGVSGAVGQGADAPAAILAATDWRDPAFDRYARTPERIEIADDGARAAETGFWIGQWRAPAPVTFRSGTYLAVWVRLPQGWRMRSETFVALRCQGTGCEPRADHSPRPRPAVATARH